MLNYHDTKKGSLFWISKIKWYVIQHQRQRTKQLFIVIIYSTTKKSKSIDFTNLKYKSKSIFL